MKSRGKRRHCGKFRVGGLDFSRRVADGGRVERRLPLRLRELEDGLRAADTETGVTADLLYENVRLIDLPDEDLLTGLANEVERLSRAVVESNAEIARLKKKLKKERR